MKPRHQGINAAGATGNTLPTLPAPPPWRPLILQQWKWPGLLRIILKLSVCSCNAISLPHSQTCTRWGWCPLLRLSVVALLPLIPVTGGPPSEPKVCSDPVSVLLPPTRPPASKANSFGFGFLHQKSGYKKQRALFFVPHSLFLWGHGWLIFPVHC